MRRATITIAIPDGLTFAQLGLARTPSGDVSFNESAIVRICEASGVDPGLFLDAPEDNVAALIVDWYSAARARGEPDDPVAESLILEDELEDRHGRGMSFAPGRA
jgi:hypothetical protein